ncbi:MAG: hypothetical protein HC905_29960 [Bacteroidales bacterium]|nr:hypothetical protein [Bacteroidales bacterium]
MPTLFLLQISKYFAQPILGKLHHEVVPVPSPEQADYPRFDSYNKRYRINKLYEGVDYDGGFSMRGSKVVGSGSETEDAIISISNKGKVLMVVRSKFLYFVPTESMELILRHYFAWKGIHSSMPMLHLFIMFSKKK